MTWHGHPAKLPSSILSFFPQKKYLFLQDMFLRMLTCWSKPFHGRRGCVKFLTLDIQVWGNKLIFRLPHLIDILPVQMEYISKSACKLASQSSRQHGGCNKQALLYFLHQALDPHHKQVSCLSRRVDPCPVTCVDAPSQGQKRQWWRGVSAGQADMYSECYSPLVTVRIFHW